MTLVITEEKNKVFINEKQTAEMMGYAVGTLRVRRAKKLPPSFYKIGTKVLYDIEDVKSYINGSKIVAVDQGKQDGQ